MLDEKETKKLLKQYEETFGEKFPVFELFYSGDPDSVLEKIKKAIKTKKRYRSKHEKVNGEPVIY